MKIKPPVKVDEQGRVIRDPAQRAHRWKLNVSAAVTGGKKQRLFFKTEKEAKAKREELLSNRQGVGIALVAELATRGMTVEDAIRFALKNAPRLDLKFIDVMGEFEKDRADHGVSPRYLTNLRSYVSRMESAFADLKLSEVSEKHISDFLKELRSRDGKAAASRDTRNHYLEVFNALFNYAKLRGYLSQSPSAALRKSAADDEEVTSLTVEEAAQLLRVLERTAHREVAPAAIMQIFLGPRRKEVPFLRWENLSSRYLRLNKVKRGTVPRAIAVMDALMEWVAPYRNAEGWVFDPAGFDIDRQCEHIANADERAKAIDLAARKLEEAFTSRLNAAAKEAGLVLEKNVLRHTAITMRVNATNDVAATSRWAGNSPAVLEAHYLGNALPEDAERFYKLRPTPQSAPTSSGSGDLGKDEDTTPNSPSSESE